MKKLFHTKSKIHSENIETDAQVKEMIKVLFYYFFFILNLSGFNVNYYIFII